MSIFHENRVFPRDFDDVSASCIDLVRVGVSALDDEAFFSSHVKSLENCDGVQLFQRITTSGIK